LKIFIPLEPFPEALPFMPLSITGKKKGQNTPGPQPDKLPPRISPISPAARTVLILNSNQLRQKDTYLKRTNGNVLLSLPFIKRLPNLIVCFSG